MPRQVLDIFLSSTSKDLELHRNKVSAMIARLRQTTIKMETFGARPNKPLDTCRAEVERCDALIVVVGHRYGWVPSKSEGGDGAKSITWWEVQWALDAGKPVYAFLIDPKASWCGEREQDRLVTAKTKAEAHQILEAVQSLEAFRSFLESTTTRDYFDSADDLGGKAATSLMDWLHSQAGNEVRSAITEKHPLPAIAASTPALRIHDPASADFLRWQEQIHLLSGRIAAGGSAEGVRVALIAGSVDLSHPALTNAPIRLIDVRLKPSESAPDAYTTALAGLLVGSGMPGDARGVAFGAELLVIRVLGGSSSTTADVLVALDAAIRENAQVVCLSLGGTSDTDAERAAYKRAADLGVILVCAGGNEGSDAPVFPAAYPHSIGVTSVDEDDRLAAFASFGPWMTTAAPAVDIPVAAENGGYQKMSGSSVACAMVAGAVALMLKKNPKLRSADVRRILQNSGPVVLGNGVYAPDKARTALRTIDVAAAVRMASQPAKQAADTQKKSAPIRRAAGGAGTRRRLR